MYHLQTDDIANSSTCITITDAGGNYVMDIISPPQGRGISRRLLDTVKKLLKIAWENGAEVAGWQCG